MPCVRISKFSRMGSWFLTHSASWDGLRNLWSWTAFKVVWPFKLLQPFRIDYKICEVKLSSLAGDQGSGWSRTIVLFIFRASFLIRYISGGGGVGTSWSPPRSTLSLYRLTLSIPEMTKNETVPTLSMHFSSKKELFPLLFDLTWFCCR